MIRSLALLLVCASLASCSKEAPPPDAAGAESQIKLGFLVSQPDAPWSQLEWQFADESAKKLGFRLVKIVAPDEEHVLAAIDNLAAQGAQGFVISTPDAQLGPAILERAEAKDLKLIAVDERFLDENDEPLKDVHYVGLSDEKLGASIGDALMAEQRRRGWPAEDTCVMALTCAELETLQARVDGALAVFETAGFPAEAILRAPLAKLEAEAATDAVETLLVQHGFVKRWLVCGPNDTAVLSAVRALEAHSFTSESVIAIGIDGTDGIAELDKPAQTGFYASVLPSAKQHGTQSCELLYKWVKDGVEPPLETLTSGVMLDRVNFRKLLKEQGLAR